MKLKPIPTREEVGEALKEAVKLALLAAGNAESLWIPLGDGRYVTVGPIEAIQRLMPRDPFEEAAANDEVRQAGPDFNFPVVRK